MALKKDYWYIIYDKRIDKWPYTSIAIRLGPYAIKQAAELHVIRSTGERVKMWTGKGWSDG